MKNRIKMSSEAPGRLDFNITRRCGYGKICSYRPKSSKFFATDASKSCVDGFGSRTSHVDDTSELQASLDRISTCHSRFSRSFGHFRTKFFSNLFDFGQIIRIISNNLFVFIRTNIEIRVIRRRPTVHIVVV